MAIDVKTIKATADSLLAAGVAKAQSFQDTYLSGHGRYAQCIQTPTIVPVDGSKLATDKTLRPYYQIEDWNALGFALPTISEVSVRIDIYDGPKGRDWCAVATFVANGIRYSKSVGAKLTEAPNTDWVETSTIDVVQVSSPA